jgi:iron-sulfur cluster assembly protein
MPDSTEDPMQAPDPTVVVGAAPGAPAPAAPVAVASPAPEGAAAAPEADVLPLEVTARAAKVMRGQLDKRGTPQAAIRYGIRGGGCTGYSYMFQYEDGPPRAKDTVVEAAFGVRLLVDPKSLLLVRGTKIDFETGMRGHGFRFTNPNIDSSCGCGESISF